jgi:hypothetical protein
MSPTELKDWLGIVAGLIGLPLAAWGLYWLRRNWRVRARKEVLEGLGQDKELAYLDAQARYMKELNRPLGYDAGEFTPGEGRLVDEAQIHLRYVFRRAQAGDMLGRTPGEITGGESARAVRDVTALLRDAKAPVVLLGDPGSGKSVTLRHLAQTLAERPVYVNALPLLPLYLHLGRWRRTGDDGLPVAFITFVQDELAQVVPHGKTLLAVLDDALAQGRVFLLLDAMDEMPTRHYNERVERINRFLVEHGGRNRVVIACRRREYSGALPHSELIVEPFSPAHIRSYLERHWALYAPRLGAAAAEDPAVRTAYLALAEPAHPMHGFATNPFSLKLVANYFFASGGQLPSAQAELFENYLRRRLDVEARRSRLSEARCAELFADWQALAFDALHNNLGTYLRRTRERAEALRVGVLCGLLREEADGALRFEHHRLLEYLAARHWDAADETLAITAEHLSNPWWRETLVLRAAVTADPATLIRNVVRAIDRRYLSVLGLKIGDEPPAEEVQDSHALRLGGIVALEIALACARARRSTLTAELYAWLEPLVMAIPQRGTLIEQVRLARALRGLAFEHTHAALAALAATDSDWLASEVFAAIDKADYAKPQFAAVLDGLMRAPSNRSLLTRLFAAKGVSWHDVMRAAPPQARQGALRLVATEAAGWAVVAAAVVLAVSYAAGRSLFFTADELAQQPSALYTLGGLLAAAAALGVWAGGWRLTLVTAVLVALAFGLLPVLSAQRITLGLVFYQFYAGPWFRRGRWLRNPVVRYLRVALALTTFERVVALWLLLSPLVILAIVGATAAPAQPLANIGLTILAVAAVEALLRLSVRRRIDGLRQRGSTLAGDTLRAHLQDCIAALRLPMPLPQAARLLDHIGSLALDEGELVAALRELADSGEFFFPGEAILRAIDRIDLRRRQKALG